MKQSRSSFQIPIVERAGGQITQTTEIPQPSCANGAPK
jgi:hypothetical protein